MSVFKNALDTHIKDKKLNKNKLDGKVVMEVAKAAMLKYTNAAFNDSRTNAVNYLNAYKDKNPCGTAGEVDKIVTKVDEFIQAGLKAVETATKKAEVAKLPKGKVHVDAIAEISTGAVAAVKMVFEKTAGGRSAPGTTGINHIHINGNAQENLLFDTSTQMILGVVDGHMEKGMTPTTRNDAAKVANRKGGSSKNMRIENGKLVEDK